MNEEENYIMVWHLSNYRNLNLDYITMIKVRSLIIEDKSVQGNYIVVDAVPVCRGKHDRKSD
jgi:hypothetical protein